LVANDVKLGQMLAESIVDVLVKGKPIKDVPVKVDPQPQLVVNAAAATRLSLEVPFDVLQAAKVVQK
jgi:putative tryptophan/tyrosine transport system substrate-binding protein